MKKSKLLFNKLLTFLLVALLAFSMVSLVACNPPETEKEEEEEETVKSDLLVTNGTFNTASNSSNSDAYLKDTVSGWSKTSGSITYSSATLGVVDLYDNEDTFKENWTSIGDAIDYPGIAPNTPKDETGAYKDTNALLVGLPDSKGSVYYKTSSSVALEKDSYYKLSIDVYTDIEQENELQGAWIFVNGDAYTEFSSIQTDSGWKTYTIYIESNNYEKRSIYIELWLGNGPKYLGSSTDKNLNPRSTTGYAMFDNILLEKQTKADTYNSVLNNDTFKGVEGVIGNTSVQSLIYPDAGFTYSSKITSISPSSSTSKVYYSTKLGSVNNYKMIVGKEDAETDDEFASYSTSYSTTGIFDMSAFYDITKDDDGKLVYTDAYEAIDTSSTSDFSAPSYKDFYDANGNFALNGLRAGEVIHDTKAMVIYHPTNTTGGLGYVSNDSLKIEANKYYTISVWVYVWAEEEYGVTKPEPSSKVSAPDGYNAFDWDNDTIASYWEYFNAKYPEPDQNDKEEYGKYQTVYGKIEDYLEDIQDHLDDVEAWEEDAARYEDAITALNSGAIGAEMKLSGASVDGTIETQSNGLGAWQQLSVNVKGNELSDRYVDLEFWYGEGEWQSSTLTAGGAIFDSVSIKVSDTAVDGTTYSELSSYTDEELAEFGMTEELTDANGAVTDFVNFGSDADSKTTDDWTFEFEDSRTSAESAYAGMIAGDKAADDAWIMDGLKNPGTLSVNYNNQADKTNLNVVMMYNKEYTATTLKYLPMESDGVTEKFIKFLPNTFYRISMWVKTIDLKASDLSVALYKEDGTSIASLAKIETEGEWSEVSFYISGSTTDVTNAYIQFTMGKGDVFTPESHVAGITYVTAMLNDTISQSEFKSASSGTYITSATISDATLSKDTVTNGLFSNIDSSNYADDLDEEIFDTEGNLTGVATPSSWTKSSAVSALSKPLNVKIVDGKLVWDAVDLAQKYYIVMDEVYDSANKLQNGYLVGEVDATTAVDGKVEWTISADAKRKGEFRVMAYSDTYGISAYSTAYKNTVIDSSVGALDDTKVDFKDYTTNSGIINYKHYDKTDYTGIYSSATAGLSYKSVQSDNLLMLNSNYNTVMGYTMSSAQTISANTYYMLSVWVKTEAGTKASITIQNTSDVFAQTIYDGEDYAKDGDYVGYVNQDTNGEWVQYRFYIQTTINSASVKLELFMGNKYATPQDIAKGKDTVSVKGGLSQGTVFFDDISLIKMADEDAFNELMTYGEENVKAPMTDIANNYFVNQYTYKVLDYTTDSFDVFDEADEDELLGGKPSDYKHYIPTSGVDYEDSEDASMLYGVYDRRDGKISADVISALNDAYADEDWFASDDKGIIDFMTSASSKVAMGNNFLFMANLTENGQHYDSSTFSIASGDYYKITFYAKTWLEKGSYAEFRFNYGDDDENWSTIKLNNNGVDVGNGMYEYSFYVTNPRSSSISSNSFSFYLGDNTSDTSDGTPTNFFKGMMIVDNIAVEKLADDKEFQKALEDYNALTEDQKEASGFVAYTFSEDVDKDDEEPEDEEDEEKPNTFDSTLWLIISSVVIGAILIAVIIILTYRKVSKKIKKKIPVKYTSNVPVNQITAEERRLAEKNTKFEKIDDEDLKD